MAETKTRGMGRGLAAILTSTRLDEESVRGSGAELRDVPVDLVAPNPHQPRRHFDEEALVALADSLRERGVLQPVLVRPVPGGTYELVAGERRWRAARLAGFDTVPALVQAHDDAASIEVALIENMAREDLNPVEEARACSVLVEELGLTREAIGKKVGRSRVAVSNLLRLLDLPDEALALLEDGTLSEGHGRALLMAPDHADRRRLARAAAEAGWTVRETEARAREAATGEREALPRSARAADPDQVEAALRLGDALSRVLGAEVRVKPAGDGYRMTLDCATHADAVELAERLGALERA